MAVVFTEGWHVRAQRLPSPNCDQRPYDAMVDTIVIHGISLPPAEFGGNHVHALFTNQLDSDLHPYFTAISDLKVSAHFFVDRAGSVTQFVSINQRAWHAGVSFFYGRSRVNDFSIGIELEGTDDVSYEQVQYATLATLLNDLLAHNPALSIERICGHCDIANGRKTDPGRSFEWARLRRLLVDRLCGRADGD